mgnify:CR=1 FL=1
MPNRIDVGNSMSPTTIDRLVPAACVVFSLSMALLSDGFAEADEITHFLISKAAWHDWTHLLNIWGRPLCTGYYALTAPLGMAACRVAAVMVMTLTALGTVQLVDGLRAGFRPAFRHWRALVWLLLFAQPFFLLHSFLLMTEMLEACLWVWAMVFLWRRRPYAAALSLGLSGLARPEGWFAIAAWPVLAWLVLPGPGRFRRVMGSWAVAILPMVAWWAAGAIGYENPRWMIDYWPWRGESQYGARPARALLGPVLATGGWQVVLTIVGLVALMRRRFEDKTFRWRALLLAGGPPAGFYLIHGVMGALGLMGSMSLPRYYVAVAPFLAALAWCGVQVTLAAVARWPAPRLRRVAAGVLLVLALSPLGVLLYEGQLPISKSSDLKRMDIAVEWFLDGPGADVPDATPVTDPRRVVAVHPYVYFALGVTQDCPGRRLLDEGRLDEAPAGTVAIVENMLWTFEPGYPSPEWLREWGWRKVEGSLAERFARYRNENHLMNRRTSDAWVQVWVKVR